MEVSSIADAINAQLPGPSPTSLSFNRDKWMNGKIVGRATDFQNSRCSIKTGYRLSRLIGQSTS